MSHSYSSLFLDSKGMDDIVTLRVRELEMARNMLSTKIQSYAEELHQLLNGADLDPRSVVALESGELHGMFQSANSQLANMTLKIRTLKESIQAIVAVKCQVLHDLLPLLELAKAQERQKRSAFVRDLEEKTVAAESHLRAKKSQFASLATYLSRLHEEMIGKAVRNGWSSYSPESAMNNTSALSSGQTKAQLLEAEISVLDRTIFLFLPNITRPDTQSVSDDGHGGGGDVDVTTNSELRQDTSETHLASSDLSDSSAHSHSVFVGTPLQNHRLGYGKDASMGAAQRERIGQMYEDVSEGREMARSIFLGFCFDAGIFDTHFGLHDADRCFDMALAGTASASTVLNGDSFRAALEMVAREKYSLLSLSIADFSLERAIQKLLTRCALSLSLCKKKTVLKPRWAELLAPSLVGVYNGFERSLSLVFSAFSKAGEMDVHQFLLMGSSFQIPVPDSEAVRIFREGSVYNREKICYSEFLIVVGLCCAVSTKTRGSMRERIERWLTIRWCCNDYEKVRQLLSDKCPPTAKPE
eukprot:ANDGO_02951.mRNA.1 hypothetical protein